MRLYLAGIYAANFKLNGSLYNRLTDNEKRQRECATYVLESYHYIHRQTFVDNIRKDGIKIFLDSGAFSSFTQGVKVDLKKYCNYIKQNLDIIEQASVLDAIGDVHGTYQNQIAMENEGVSPLPCFHYGEDERYLDYYVNNYEYITLGGMVPISTPQLRIWLDRIWERNLTDGAGRPKVKVHGFGLTTVSLMERYPWYSVDSSSWVQTARVGGMLILPEAKIINVSDRSPQRKVRGQHIDNVSEIERQELENRLQRAGVDTDRMRETYLSRWAYNIWAFDQLGKNHLKDDPMFKADKMELF